MLLGVFLFVTTTTLSKPFNKKKHYLKKKKGKEEKPRIVGHVVELSVLVFVAVF